MNAYFTATTRRGLEELKPEPLAVSAWGTGQVTGFAVSGALARSVESVVAQHGLDELHMTRWTVDLLRAAVADDAVVAESAVVRAGRRLCLAEAHLIQRGTIVARASALFLRPGGVTIGTVQSPQPDPSPPPEDLEALPPNYRLFRDGAAWSTKPDERVSGDVRAIWHVPLPVVSGESPTPMQAAASVADGANLALNWGTANIEFINADVTLHLSRMPDLRGIGLVRVSRSEHAGITVGTALMFDRNGVIGTSAMSGLGNSHAAGHLQEYFASNEKNRGPATVESATGPSSPHDGE